MANPLKAADVTAEPVEWLLPNRIPRGEITVVAGKPDQGKGLFGAWLAAQVSQEGGNVLYSAAEDSVSRMTRPRLEVAGADLDRVFIWSFGLPDQYAELKQIVVDNDVKLVVIDPLAAHLTDGVSRTGDNIRKVTNALRSLTEETGVTVLIVEHVLKARLAKGSHPREAIAGSGSGVLAAARVAFLFGADPDDPDRRVLAEVKFNVGEHPKAMAFETDVEELEEVGKQPSLVSEGETDFDPRRLLEAKDKDGSPGRKPDKRALAAEWLVGYLHAAEGPVKASLTLQDAKLHGLTVKTVRRAADDLDVVKNPPKGGRHTTWDLPQEIKDALDAPAAGEDDGGEE